MVRLRKMLLGVFILLSIAIIAVGYDSFLFLNSTMRGPNDFKDLMNIGIRHMQSQGNLKEDIRSRFPGLLNAIRAKVLENNQEMSKEIKKHNLPLLGIVMSRDDIAHFSDIYKKFNDPAHGVEYYEKKNKWRKAKLTFEGKTFDIKVKSHGRRPTNHQEGRFISLAIKLAKGNQIMNSRRFSLIVRSKMPASRNVLLDLAQRNGIIIQDYKMLRVKINNWEEKLYLFTHRLNDKFMEARGKSSYRRFEYSNSTVHSSNKSLVINTPEGNLASYRKMLEFALQEAEVSPDHARAIQARYGELNNTIVDGDYASIGQYFDPEYISTFDALRTVTALRGHGWNQENLYMFLNTANGLFYPAMTRDNVTSNLRLNEFKTPERQINTYRDIVPKLTRFPLWDALSRNDDIRQRKYKKIYQDSLSYPDNLEAMHAEKFTALHKLHYYGQMVELLVNMGMYKDNWIPDNFAVLKAYLENSKPKLHTWANKNKISIVVDPQSMSALRFDSIAFTNFTDVAPKSGRLKITLTTTIEGIQEHEAIADVNYQMVGGRIDLANPLKGLRFSTSLDKDNYAAHRRYRITFHIKNLSPAAYSEQNLETKLINTVTGQSIYDNMTIAGYAPGNISETIDIPSIAQQSDKEHEFRVLQNRFPHVPIKRTENGEITIQPGSYKIMQDFILPRGFKLVLVAGTTLLLGEDVVVVGFNGLDVKGSANNPVTISAENPLKPFGSVGILGQKNTGSDINYLHLSHGSERWLDGVFFSGGLSIHYNKNVYVNNSTITFNHADDGMNIKYAKHVIIENSDFINNFADQIDLDYCSGTITGSRFLNTTENDDNGDGLDVSGSSILVQDSNFIGFGDKGISIGEASTLLARENRLIDNLNGIAVKDLSQLFFLQSTFEGNGTDIIAYQKKEIFGGGSVFMLQKFMQGEKLSYKMDSKSQLFTLPSSTVDIVPEQIESLTAFNTIVSNLLGLSTQQEVTVAPELESFIK